LKSSPKAPFQLTILIKGAGEVASAIAHKLAIPCFRLCLTDLPEPTAVRRGVTFSEAIYDGEKMVEGVTARLATSPGDAGAIWSVNKIPLFVDPSAKVREYLKPDIVVDAIIAKRNSGTRVSDASLVIGVGPGFMAPRDCHVVIETNRGHSLGRLISKGEAESDTGVPAPVMGVTDRRVIRAPSNGKLSTTRDIGVHLKIGDSLGHVNGIELKAETDGVLRGFLRHGSTIASGMKIGDIDPRDVEEYCFTISDKGRTIAGGVLEAVLKYYPPTRTS